MRRATLEQMGLTYEVVGSGSTVVSQSPTTGTSVAKGGKVLLYTEQTTTRDLVTVPNLIGMTASQANETLSYYGLNYALMGASASSEGSTGQEPVCQGRHTATAWLFHHTDPVRRRGDRLKTAPHRF